MDYKTPLRMINKSGRDIQIQTITTPMVDKSTPDQDMTPTITTQDTVGVFEGVVKPNAFNGLPVSIEKIMIPVKDNDGNSIDLTTDNKIIDGDTTYTIHYIEKVKPGNDAYMYNVGLREG